MQNDGGVWRILEIKNILEKDGEWVVFDLMVPCRFCFRLS